MEKTDMWVALGLMCRRFTRLELREVEEDVRNLQQRQHLGCGQILVFYRSVCGFLVIDGEEDDLVPIDGATTTTKWFSWCSLMRVMAEADLLGFGDVNGGFAEMVEDDDDLWLAADSEVEVVEIGFGAARIDVTVALHRELWMVIVAAQLRHNDKGQGIRVFVERMIMWQLTWQG
ncbi:hypothetical protein V8G54_020854 [Vigna mungo]|uniref:Uncharacterized protein n=1 Tax=Vigna mungo TaxID=3915 RepID=A0AAQ3NGB1_VIGMU